MEDYKFNSGPTRREVKIEDAKLFGELLAARRNHLQKNISEAAGELGMTRPSKLRAIEEGRTLPTKKSIPDFARVYSFLSEELSNIHQISKEAHELKKKSQAEFSISSD